MKLQGYQAALSAPSAPVLENAPPLPVGATGQVLLWADGAPAWSELPNSFDQPLNTTDDPTFLSGSFASLFDGTSGSVAYAQSAAFAGYANWAITADDASYASYANWANWASTADDASYASYANWASTASYAIYASYAASDINFPTFFSFTQGAAIPNQVGTVSAADFNAVLAILRAMKAIAT